MSKRLTACYECRKKKVRCDEARPGCGQCRRKERECPGYRSKSSFLLQKVDEQGDILTPAGTMKSFRQVHHTDSTTLESHRQPNASAAASLELAQTTPTETTVALWRTVTALESGDVDMRIGARMTRACLDCLAFFLDHTNVVRTPNRKATQLRRCHAAIKLWADGYDVWTDGLDQVLEQSVNLRLVVLSVLHSLCKLLLHGLSRFHLGDQTESRVSHLCRSTRKVCEQAKWLLAGLNEGSDSSDSETDGSSDEDAHAINDGPKRSTYPRFVEEVQVLTDCVVDTGMALENPAKDAVHTDQEKPGALTFEHRYAHDYHSNMIVAKFPMVERSLADSLGRMNWQRYQRMQHEREYNAIMPSLTHTDQPKSLIASSAFQDSGLGSSLPSGPPLGYAETVISFMTSIGGGKRVQIPSLPAEAKKGNEFACHACGKLICANNNRSWRKHLFSDLQPYTCLFSTCYFNGHPFQDRQLWSKHLEMDHHFGPEWNSTSCPLCLDLTGAGKTSVLVHFARHLEDIALAALSRDVESDADSEVDTETDEDTLLAAAAVDEIEISAAKTSEDESHALLRYQQLRKVDLVKFQKGDYHGAIEACSAMVELCPQDATGYSDRAKCLIKLGSFVSAVEDCDKAMMCDPSYLRPYLSKAEALFWMSEYARCIDVCREAEKFVMSSENSQEIESRKQMAVQAQIAAVERGKPRQDSTNARQERLSEEENATLANFFGSGPYEDLEEPVKAPEARSTKSRAPAENKQAFIFLNKVKAHFGSQPPIFQTFLELLRACQDLSTSDKAHNALQYLLVDAPDLLKELDLFLTGRNKNDTGIEQAIEEASSTDSRKPIPSGALNDGISNLDEVVTSLAPHADCEHASHAKNISTLPRKGKDTTGRSFTWITVNDPAELKTKTVMSAVREQAMSHYLGGTTTPAETYFDQKKTEASMNEQHQVAHLPTELLPQSADRSTEIADTGSPLVYNEAHTPRFACLWQGCTK